MTPSLQRLRVAWSHCKAPPLADLRWHDAGGRAGRGFCAGWPRLGDGAQSGFQLCPGLLDARKAKAGLLLDGTDSSRRPATEERAGAAKRLVAKIQILPSSNIFRAARFGLGFQDHAVRPFTSARFHE